MWMLATYAASTSKKTSKAESETEECQAAVGSADLIQIQCAVKTEQAYISMSVLAGH